MRVRIAGAFTLVGLLLCAWGCTEKRDSWPPAPPKGPVVVHITLPAQPPPAGSPVKVVIDKPDVGRPDVGVRDFETLENHLHYYRSVLFLGEATQDIFAHSVVYVNAGLVPSPQPYLDIILSCEWRVSLHLPEKYPTLVDAETGAPLTPPYVLKPGDYRLHALPKASE